MLQYTCIELLFIWTPNLLYINMAALVYSMVQLIPLHRQILTMIFKYRSRKWITWEDLWCHVAYVIAKLSLYRHCYWLNCPWNALNWFVTIATSVIWVLGVIEIYIFLTMLFSPVDKWFVQRRFHPQLSWCHHRPTFVDVIRWCCQIP